MLLSLLLPLLLTPTLLSLPLASTTLTLLASLLTAAPGQVAVVLPQQEGVVSLHKAHRHHAGRHGVIPAGDLRLVRPVPVPGQADGGVVTKLGQQVRPDVDLGVVVPGDQSFRRRPVGADAHGHHFIQQAPLPEHLHRADRHPAVNGQHGPQRASRQRFVHAGGRPAGVTLGMLSQFDRESGLPLHKGGEALDDVARDRVRRVPAQNQHPARRPRRQVAHHETGLVFPGPDLFGSHVGVERRVRGKGLQRHHPDPVHRQAADDARTHLRLHKLDHHRVDLLLDKLLHVFLLAAGVAFRVPPGDPDPLVGPRPFLNEAFDHLVSVPPLVRDTVGHRQRALSRAGRAAPVQEATAAGSQQDKSDQEQDNSCFSSGHNTAP